MAPAAVETLSARSALRVFAFCSKRGHDAAKLGRRVGLRLEQLRPDDRVPYETMERLAKLALEVTGDPEFGLHLAEDVRETSEYDAGLLALMASPTLGAAFERLRSIQRYWGDGTRTTFQLRDDGLLIRYQLPGATGEYARHADECAMAELAIGIRVLAERPLFARRVRFRHRAPSSTAEHQRIFGCRLEFAAPYTEMELEPQLLETPLPHANPAFLANFDRQVAGMLSQLPELATTAAAVRESCRTRLSSPDCNVATTARLLRLSTRTLQRRLRAEGTSFARILDALRYELAMERVQCGAPAVEIADALGYADVTAFHHAFRRWTGSSPARVGARKSG